MIKFFFQISENACASFGLSAAERGAASYLIGKMVLRVCITGGTRVDLAVIRSAIQRELETNVKAIFAIYFKGLGLVHPKIKNICYFLEMPAFSPI